MDAFKPFLGIGLKNYAEYQVEAKAGSPMFSLLPGAEFQCATAAGEEIPPRAFPPATGSTHRLSFSTEFSRSASLPGPLFSQWLRVSWP